MLLHLVLHTEQLLAAQPRPQGVEHASDCDHKQQWLEERLAEDALDALVLGHVPCLAETLTQHVGCSRMLHTVIG